MSIIDLLFPKFCLECGKSGVYICKDCVFKVKPSKQVCPYCYKSSIDGMTHFKCTRKYGLDGLVSVWKYEDVIRKALIALKYKYATEVGKELQSYIATELQKTFIPSAQCLVPVPLYWYRENFRGFNQSEFLGKQVAKALNIKFVSDLIMRKKLTTPQVALKGEMRRKNLKNVFMVSPHNSLFTIPDSILLFDDVFTTGSTLKECAKVLKKWGVKKVWGLTIAR